MITHLTNAYQSAWRTAKLAYHTLAFVSLASVVFLLATHRVSGYAQANLAYGQDELAPLVTAANTPLPVAQPKRIAEAAPRPAEKPAAPPKAN